MSAMETRTPLPPVPRARVLAYVLGGAVGTVAVVTVLWWAGTRGLVGSELVTARLDALRVGLSIAVGGGGVFALHLAWRRQRATEADLDNRERALAHQLQVAADTKAHQERVAAATEEDAAIRRVTDLFTKAVELLGSDKAAVRLGAIHAMANLAQDNPAQRRTVVDVLCAYLRMPFTPPTDENAADPHEAQVRLTVQRQLARHLRPGTDDFWPGMNLDLTGATLVKLDLSGCEVDVAQFRTATFVGPALFEGATFGRSAGFARATFTDTVAFDDITFRGNAVFRFTTFTRGAGFAGATFRGYVNFESASFGEPALFDGATFAHPPDFTDAKGRLPKTREAPFHP